MVGKIAGGGVLLATLVVLYFVFRGDTEKVSAESKYDGVHLCSPSQREAEALRSAASPAPTPTLVATPTPAADASQPATNTGGPSASAESPGRTLVGGGANVSLFFQNNPTWGAQEYDHGRQQDVGCGTTIAECGCAMTSVTNVLSLFQVLTTPDGTALNPSSLNNWFNKGAQLTNAGWVAQGFVSGSVVWGAVNSFKSSATSEGGAAINVRFSGWGSGSEAEIRSELSQGRPVVLEVPGHYIAAVGLQGNDILINDPFYPNRTTLASYAGRVKSSRKYAPSNDLRAMMLTVPGGTRIQVTDSQGRIVGTVSPGNPVTVAEAAKKEIPGATYHFEEQWRDPTCTERPPNEGAGVNTIFLPFPESGRYQVRAVNHEGNETAVGVGVGVDPGATTMPDS